MAKLLDLPYPGGPEVEKLAKRGKPSLPLKPGKVKKNRFAFSFSGLKTGVLYQVKGQNGSKKSETVISEEEKANVAASFQKAACKDVVEKAIDASQEFSARCIVMGGGVTCNKTLRALFQEKADLPLFFPPKGLSLDNGAMIAGLGYHLFQRRGADALDLMPHARLELYPPCGVSEQRD